MLQPRSVLKIAVRQLAAASNNYKLICVGGGAGGVAIAAKFSRTLGEGAVAVVEPSDTHYYQPLWTLVGAGIKKLSDSSRPTATVMPPKAKWIQDKVIEFDPSKNQVKLSNGNWLSYEYLVVAVGIELDFGRIKGLPEAFNTPGVCSNYSKDTVDKTHAALKEFKGGKAIFTSPVMPIKCAGAPQKILYLADAYFRQKKVRNQSTLMYNLATPKIFGVQYFAEEMVNMCDQRDIVVNYETNLVEVRPESKDAIFEDMKTKELKRYSYEMIHITPPMKAPDVVKPLADPSGFMSVDKETLQHTNYKNIFGIGDCTNAPTSKTAAAVAGQAGVVEKNLKSVMKGKKLTAKYDGYASCPLVTGNNKCVMIEFDYDGKPLPTFPILDARKESKLMYLMKKDVVPFIYWNGLLKGWWNGPKFYRKLLHLGLSR